MNKSVAAICIALLLVFASCKSADTARDSDTEKSELNDFNSALKSKVGSDPIAEENEAGTFILYKEKPGGHARKKYKFIVVRKSDNKIIHEGQYQMGHVKWSDNASLELVSSETGEQTEKKFINLNINK